MLSLRFERAQRKIDKLLDSLWSEVDVGGGLGMYMGN